MTLPLQGDDKEGSDDVTKRVLIWLGLWHQLKILYKVDADEKDKNPNRTKLQILLDSSNIFPEQEYDG